MAKKVFLFIVLFCLLFSTVALADEVDTDFVLFIIDQVSLREVLNTKTPNLDYLVNQGAVGLMNCRTDGSLTAPDTYLTIGAGRRANTNLAANYTFNVNNKFKGEKIKKLYQAQTGNSVNGARVVNIRFSEIVKDNLAGDYLAHPGALGQILEKAGMQVAVLGNSDYRAQDLDYELGREAALIGINKKGSLKLGDVGRKNLINTDQHPFGFLTNQQYLINEFQKLRSEAELIIVESGDTARLAAIRDALLPKRYNQLKKEMLQRVDNLLGRLLKEINLDNQQIMVIVPTPAPRAKAQARKLTLNVLAGDGVEPGLLTTSTTKRAGFITNLDIAPTILNSIDLEKSIEGLGSPIKSINFSSPLAKLKEMNNEIIKTFTRRPFLIKGFILLQIIILILAALIILFKDKVNRPFKKLVEHLLLTLLVIPIFLLLSNFFIDLNIYLLVVLFIFFSLGLIYILKRSTSHELDPLLIVINLTSLLLILDLWTGANLIKTSVLGYSPVIGARYYGLGNEFMGLLIGSVLIGSTGIFDRFFSSENRLEYILLFIFVLVVITIGHPRLGANFGGFLTALAALIFTYGLIKGYQFDFRQLLVIMILVSGLIGVLILYDTLSSQNYSTHIGRTISLIKNGGLKEVLRIIYRKLSTNLKLLRWTIWTKVILAFIVMLTILFKYPIGLVRKIIDDYSYLRYGFSGVVCGSIVTMLVNDSGVVATATLLLPAVIALVYLVIQRIEL